MRKVVPRLQVVEVLVVLTRDRHFRLSTGVRVFDAAKLGRKRALRSLRATTANLLVDEFYLLQTAPSLAVALRTIHVLLTCSLLLTIRALSLADELQRVILIK